MAKVPTYSTGQIRERGINQQGMTVRASAEAFGASAGQGLVSLSQGVAQAGDALSGIRALEDEAAAREARNGYMRERDRLLYDPEAGFLNQQGANALDQRTKFEQSLRDLRATYAKKLTPAQSGLFNRAVEGLEIDAQRSALIHAGRELKSFVVSEGLAGAETFQMQALRNVADPKLREKYTAAAMRELRGTFEKQGLSAEEIDLRERSFLSDTVRKMALTIGNSDAVAAMQFIDENAHRLDPVTLADLREGPIRTKALAAKGEQNAAALIAGLPMEPVLSGEDSAFPEAAQSVDPDSPEKPAQMPAYSADGLAAIDRKLAAVTDPEEREATRTAIDRYYTMRKKAKDLDREQAQDWASAQLARNPAMDILAMPMELQEALGPSGMSTLLEYQRKIQAAGQPSTDERVLYQLQTQYAQDPAGFAQLDLFEYRPQLSDADWSTVTGWRQTALTDKRKAAEEGANLTTAFSQATQALKAVGITTAGLDPKKQKAKIQQVEKRIAEFQSALTGQIREFQQANDGRAPTFVETHEMVNRLLLPIAIEEPGALWGTKRTRGQFLFEAGQRPDGSEVEIEVPYEDIPIDFRRSITQDLTAELGRRPSQDEITNRYEQFLLGE